MTSTTRIITPMLAVAALAGAAETASADTPVEPRRLTVQLPPNGKAEFLDFDHDGRWEHVRFDLDGDGTRDVIVQDTDGDGRYDVRWIDRDGDHEIDDSEMERLTKKARRNRCTRQRRAPRCARRGRAHRVAGSRRPITLTQVEEEGAATVPPATGEPVGQNETPAQQQQPPAGLPANVKPTGMSFDLDGDGEQETVQADDTLGANGAYPNRSDADADFDDVVIGTKDGGRALGVHKVDNDPADDELVVCDPTLSPNQSYGRDLDGDGDIDLVVIGTKDGAEVGGAFSLDADGNDQEILVYDPQLAQGSSYDLDLDGDGDGDVKVVGTK